MAYLIISGRRFGAFSLRSSSHPACCLSVSPSIIAGDIENRSFFYDVTTFSRKNETDSKSRAEIILEIVVFELGRGRKRMKAEKIDPALTLLGFEFVSGAN